MSSDTHAKRWERVRQLRALEKQIAELRPEVEDDLKGIIEDFRDLGVCDRMMAEQLGYNRSLLSGIIFGRPISKRYLSGWMETLLSYWDESPWQQIEQKEKNVARVRREADRARQRMAGVPARNRR
jgi:hypothetical protein